MRIQDAGAEAACVRTHELSLEIDMPPTASALPTEGNADFGTSAFYEQRSARFYV
jgi:hypothetical protein